MKDLDYVCLSVVISLPPSHFLSCLFPFYLLLNSSTGSGSVLSSLPSGSERNPATNPILAGPRPTVVCTMTHFNFVPSD